MNRMNELATKSKFLKNEGYKYNFLRGIYVNQSKKKIFSIQAIERNRVNWLDCKDKEKNDSWKIYFLDEPSNVVKNILLARVNK